MSERDQVSDRRDPASDDLLPGAPSRLLLDLVVCPLDHAALEWASDQALCGQCGRRYRIIGGVVDLRVRPRE